MDVLLHTSALFRLGLAGFVGGLCVVAVAAAALLRRVARRQTAGEDVARRLFRNSAGPLVIQLAVRAIDLGLAKVLYTLLEKTEVGNYNLAGLLVTLILATVADWGLTIWLTREVARDPQAIGRLFGTTVAVRALLGLLAIPLAALVIGGFAVLRGANVIAHGLSAQDILLIAILLPSLLPSGFAAAATAVFLATEQPITPALANLLNNSLATLLQIGLLLVLGVVGVALGASLSTLTNALLFAWLLRRWGGVRLRWQWDRALARAMLRTSFPLMLNALLIAVFFRFDQFVIQAYLGESAVADYGAAYKYAPLALVLPPIVINAVFPLFARQALHDRGALLRGYRLTLRLLLLIALPLATGLAVFAPQAIRLVAEGQYVPRGAPALALLIWFVPWSYLNGVAQYVLIALERQATITWAFGVTAVFNLVANSLLVPRWGINAAAAITVLSEIVLYVPFGMMLRRELGDAPLWTVAWRPALAAAVAAAAMLPLRSWLFAALLVGAVVYAAALWLLRTFTAEDRHIIMRIVGKVA